MVRGLAKRKFYCKSCIPYNGGHLQEGVNMLPMGLLPASSLSLEDFSVPSPPSLFSSLACNVSLYKLCFEWNMAYLEANESLFDPEGYTP